jgi:hypothetical protein
MPPPVVRSVDGCGAIVEDPVISVPDDIVIPNCWKTLRYIDAVIVVADDVVLDGRRGLIDADTTLDDIATAILDEGLIQGLALLR